MRAKVLIAMYRTFKNENVRTKLIFRDYGNYACLKLKFGKDNEQPTIWSKLYKSERLLKRLDGIKFEYQYFKH